jgi:hypothetical protein
LSAQLAGPSAAGFTAGADCRQAGHHGLQGLAVVRVGGGDPNHQREFAASERTCSLEPGLAQSTGLGPGPVNEPPFSGRLAASKMAEDQSISPRLTSRSRIRRCGRGHSPACVQAVNRRCAVGAHTPNEGGRCRQAQPLVNTNTIAVKHGPIVYRRRPPPCRRGTNRDTTAPPAPTARPEPDSPTDDHPYTQRCTTSHTRHALAKRVLR